MTVYRRGIGCQYIQLSELVGAALYRRLSEWAPTWTATRCCSGQLSRSVVAGGAMTLRLRPEALDVLCREEPRGSVEPREMECRHVAFAARRCGGRPWRVAPLIVQILRQGVQHLPHNARSAPGSESPAARGVRRESLRQVAPGRASPQLPQDSL